MNDKPTAHQRTFQDQQGKENRYQHQQKNRKGRIFGQLGVLGWALLLAIASGQDLKIAQRLEREGQNTFFQIRGTKEAPQDIIIVAIDNYSLDQGQLYFQDPQKLAYFETISRFPYQRKAYATVIKKILDSGAKSVGVDLIFDAPSSYGEQDDQSFYQVLQDYAGKITLAAIYEADDNRTGGLMNLFKPHTGLQTNPMSIGTINYPLEADGRVHQFASEFVQIWSEENPDLAKEFKEFVAVYPSFPEAILTASGLSFEKNQGTFINFYGKAKTFQYIPFVDILDPESWQSYLENGAIFQDKIVLIGPTANIFQDAHLTPIATEKMPGVEIHANAIATLREGKAIQEVIKQPWLKGLVIFSSIMGIGLIFLWRRRWLTRLKISISLVVIWLIISYLCFIYANLFIPTVIPILGIFVVGISYSVRGALKEVFNWLELRQTFKHYASSPIVQEIIAQQDDLQDLLAEKETEILNRKLGGRYQIIKALSEGGFGKTYIAKDLQRPGEPKCVVKKLEPVSNNPDHWQVAKRMFISEAQVLEKLGHHDQIPQLLAYFDDGEEFYLVQELIIGEPLSKELPRFLDGSEERAISILEDLLPVLDFIHSQGVIHRDLKPANVIRRRSDDQLILIDFGTVKELSQQFLEELRLTQEQKKFTIAIGTKGYTPPEQAAGTPRFNSDIFALGMIAIQALTLLHPSLIDQDPETDRLLWEENVETNVHPQLINIINKMVERDFQKRYQTAKDVLKDLREYEQNFQPSLLKSSSFHHTSHQNYDYNSAEIATSDLSSPSIHDISEEPTALPVEDDFDLTDAPTIMPEENEDFDLTNLPTQSYNDDDIFTDLPTVIPEDDHTIDQPFMTREQHN